MSGSVTIAAVLCLAAGLGAGALAADGLPDTAVGLVKGSVLDVPAPPPVTPNRSGPGEQPPLPRPYAIAPPAVPHAIADFLPITRQDNACVGCHEVSEKKPGEPTPIPPSHYVDLRNAPDRVASRLAGARWVCVSCHVSTTDARDLVENRFRP